MNRSDFPLLQTMVHGKPLLYLDSAATSQKPQAVIDAMTHFYTTNNANVHRGVYTLAEKATQLYGQARDAVAQFIGARLPEEIVFTRGTTESINCFAASWAYEHVGEGDEILISELEHHANVLPWQHVATRNKAKLIYIPVHTNGTLDLTKLSTLMTSRTKLVAISHVSHALGTHNDIPTLVAAAHSVGAVVLLDAAQSVPHQKVDVTELDVDALAFSGHKMLGPTGCGVLYIAQRIHHQLVPYQRGGSMVYEADFSTATWQPMPRLLEAGTPPIAEVVGLHAAITYMRDKVDYLQLRMYYSSLSTQLINGLLTIEGVTVLGPINELKRQGHIVSFTVDGMHSHDIAAYLDSYGICVRAGHQCAQPLAKKLRLQGSVRASFHGYTTAFEVDQLIDALKNMARLR